MRVHFIGRIMCAALCASALARPAIAQETVNTASVSGRVTDPQGAVVPGAQVVARQTETNVTRETVTDGDGRFRFPYLRIGPYEIKISLQGFRDATRVLTLTVGSAFDIPITLALGEVSADVTVTGETTLLETARSQIAGTVSETEIQSVPLNGRNFLDLALLVPGATPTNTASTQLFAETSAVTGTGLSINSQRNFSNNFIVDGFSANDDAAGLSGIPYGVDAVEQFQVVTSGGQAEFGRALGGYVNVVTKSGTNLLRGDAYGYFRDDAWNAPNALTGTTLPMHQNQYGASLGGPIARNRTFYFTNFEQRQLDQSGLTTISQANVAVINAKLAAVNYPGSPVTTGVYANPVDSSNFLGKVDHQFSNAEQLSVRYALYDVTSSNSRGAGALSAPSASAGLDNIDQTIGVSNTWMVSSRTVNETRAQYTYSDLKAPPTDPVGPAVNISGVASFGTLSGSPTRRTNSLFQVVNNLSHQSGAHALRAGLDFIFNDTTITFPRAIRGTYAFSSLSNFLAGVYNNAGFTQTFGDTLISQTNPNLGIYAQDEWKLSSQLTFNAGLRYDLQFLQTINTDTNNLSPRVGIVWSPSESSTTIVRATAGLFFDRIPLRALANALLSAANTTDLTNLRQNNVSLSPTQAGAPRFPGILSAPVPSVTLPNLSTMDQNMQEGRSSQAGVEVERQIGSKNTISVGYQYLRGRNLIISINQNVPSCVASGTNNGCRPNPDYGNNGQYSSEAYSTYHGLHVSWLQRPMSWGYYRVSYTWSKAMSNVGEFFFSSPIDPYDISKDWGRSDDDQRHRLVVNAAVNSPMGPARTTWERISHGFQVSTLLQAYSALPFNIVSGVTTIQGTTGRPIVNGEYIARNSGELTPFFTWSMRVSRDFRLGPHLQAQGLIEAFNLTNHTNVVTVNNNFGTGAYPASPLPAFNQVTSVGDPRSFQLGVRLRF
jgi:hypothetical protein